MVNERVKSVGGYFMRLLGGVAVILGILGAFTGLYQGNLVGLVFSVVFIVGGSILLKRSGAIGAGDSASTPRGTR